MAVKMNLRMITKNYAADLEIGFLAESISKSNGCATAMSTVLELSVIKILQIMNKSEIFFIMKKYMRIKR